MSRTTHADYAYRTTGSSHVHARLLEPILELAGPLASRMRVLDAGCGNGFLCGEFIARDCEVFGVDPSVSGVRIAQAEHGAGTFEVMPVELGLLERLNTGPFDLVLSMEVIEHVYAPRTFVKGCWEALRPGGRLICSTPYHGYLKNLALSLVGKWDSHADPLWDGGHIKLWSRRTLCALLSEAGFTNIRFRGAGRLPFLWMSMVLSADRPL